ncbi:hypothetical protein NN3_61780 [Nocardia neocaledoniensis NBRC 108232]|uniref:Uncharacterized protein n=1 Tax=Nocardia neocaledoniensis TaxID=236511 RepID=A0A317NFZ5_9NOCA|nr:hypothetical protein [Nocardia neocaledoniensis]PWV74306.1 hypothetical protein DFR69_106117 [Nocardia neocaledoniensis]GEM35171.1 hypothetical protein NN3_61780 [Nocardia neocaledoniensis NBRC 108232]
MVTREAEAQAPPRRWVWAMRAATVVAVAAVVAILLNDATEFDLLAGLAAVAALFAAGVVWMVFAPIGCARYRRYGTVLIAPLAVVAGLGAYSVDAPDRVAWWLSKSSLTDAAHGNCAGDGGWYGVVRVRSVLRDDGGCLFRIGDGIGGLAYFPPGGGPPLGDRGAYEPVYTPYDGDWYAFTVDLHGGH